MIEYAGKCSISKHLKSGHWRATLRYREFEEVTNDDGTITKVYSKWRQKTRLLESKCNEKSNVGRNNAADEAEGWRLSILKEQEDAARRVIEMQRQEAERARLEEEKRNAVTVGQWCEKLIIDSDVQSSTKRSQYEILKRITVLPEKDGINFGGIVLSELTTDDVMGWRRWLMDKYKPTTRKHTWTFLKACVTRAVEEDRLAKNPFVKSMKAPVTNEEAHTMTETKSAPDDETCRRALAILTSVDATDAYRVASTVALLTGMRRSEICALTWKNVDLDNDVIHVEQAIKFGTDGCYIGTPKTYDSRDVPISEPLHRILTLRKVEMREECMRLGVPFTDELFVTGTYNGRYLSPKSLTDWWNSFAEFCGIKTIKGTRCGFHELRHAFVTTMRRAGVARKVRCTITGHSDGTVHGRYDNPTMDDLREAVALVAQAYAGGSAGELLSTGTDE